MYPPGPDVYSNASAFDGGGGSGGDGGGGGGYQGTESADEAARRSERERVEQEHWARIERVSTPFNVNLSSYQRQPEHSINVNMLSYQRQPVILSTWT